MYITSRNIRAGHLDLSEVEYIDAAQHSTIFKRCDVRTGDILLTKDGASTGNAALNTITEEISLLSSVAFLRFDPGKHNAGYYLQSLLSFEGQRQIQEQMSGNAITRLTLAKIKNLRFPVPPTKREEDVITAALSDADGLIEGLEALIAKKRAIKQGAMQELLSGRRRLAGFNGKWETKHLGELASFYKGKGLSKDDLSPFGSKSCIHYGELFTKYGETITSISSFTDGGRDSFLSKANDVLMPTSDVTPYGLAKASCVLIDGVILGGDILVIRVDKNSLDGSFLSHVIRMDEAQVLQLVTGTTVFHLYATDMKKFSFCVPDLAEQKAIVNVLSDMTEDIGVLELKLSKARQIKQGMMQDLLTGRVRLV